MFLHYRLVTAKETVSAFGGLLTPAILRELIRDRWVKLFSITLPSASYALTSSESLKHRRAITGALAGRTCDMILGQTITALDTVNSGQDPPKLGMNEMIARKKVFGEKGVNP